MTLPVFFSKFNKDISWLSSNTIYLVRHGSHAYGTNTPTSDEDFKGICIPTKPYFLGATKRFEQAELHEPDVVIYDIRKFFILAADCNPNALEVLFVDPEDIIHVTDLGEELLENRNYFLSKKVKYTMTGYAVSQLKRIRLHKRWLLNPPSHMPSRSEYGLPETTLIPADQLMAAEAEVRKELDRFQFDFMEGLDESQKIEIRTIMEAMLSELKITTDQHWMAAARKIGLSDNFIQIMQQERQYAAAKREWDQYQNWKATRNKARAALEEKYGYDTKHAYHLVRLIRMCREVLITGKVIVKRPDREELLAIRNGAWTYEQLIDFAEREEKALNELYQTSKVLPKIPDKEKLDNLCIRLVEKSLKLN
jgi:predicted nucleotidyltransferase